MCTDKKTCLITGASSGIGKEIALGLAKLGIHVILVCRQAEKGQRVLEEIKTTSDSKNVDLLIADLSSQNEIRSLVNTIYNRYPSLNILINNAGIVSTKKQYSVDGIEMTIATNHLGPFLLTHLLLDLLKKSASPRIINVSSAIHKWAKIDLTDLQFNHRKYHFMKAYAQSKLLMNATTFELAKQLEKTNITVNCLHPGAVKTNLGSNNATNFFLRKIDKIIKSFFITPAMAAKTPLYLATSSEVENITGKYFIKCKPVSSKTISPELSKKIWEISKELVKI
jgi:NAD(P)-dependent dehydrogenase (short-subunit alcohol dehydrogenase family)